MLLSALQSKTRQAKPSQPKPNPIRIQSTVASFYLQVVVFPMLDASFAPNQPWRCSSELLATLHRQPHRLLAHTPVPVGPPQVSHETSHHLAHSKTSPRPVHQWKPPPCQVNIHPQQWRSSPERPLVAKLHACQGAQTPQPPPIAQQVSPWRDAWPQ